jgi:hypothetical protein
LLISGGRSAGWRHDRAHCHHTSTTTPPTATCGTQKASASESRALRGSLAMTYWPAVGDGRGPWIAAKLSPAAMVADEGSIAPRHSA